MDARTIAMFKHLQQTLRMMAKDWYEPCNRHADGSAKSEPDDPEALNAAG